mmetsp:Transcript_296/g.1044  ORF Transcript_296/g.1044 Transcript_296/m.1044 type:complete len:291 (+) Transcript_296:562-1434(+)
MVRPEKHLRIQLEAVLRRAPIPDNNGVGAGLPQAQVSNCVVQGVVLLADRVRKVHVPLVLLEPGACKVSVPVRHHNKYHGPSALPGYATRTRRRFAGEDAQDGGGVHIGAIVVGPAVGDELRARCLGLCEPHPQHWQQSCAPREAGCRGLVGGGKPQPSQGLFELGDDDDTLAAKMLGEPGVCRAHPMQRAVPGEIRPRPRALRIFSHDAAVLAADQYEPSVAVAGPVQTRELRCLVFAQRRCLGRVRRRRFCGSCHAGNSGPQSAVFEAVRAATARLRWAVLSWKCHEG